MSTDEEEDYDAIWDRPLADLPFGVNDKIIRIGLTDPPLTQLTETGDAWRLFTFAISKHQPWFSNGWAFSLRPESRFYKRTFDFPDLGKRGHAIVFRIFDPVGEPTKNYELCPGWVPAEREADADRWIAFLNDQIQARLREAAAKSTAAG